MEAKEKKAVRLNLRLTAKQNHDLKQVASQTGISVSALVRKGIEWALKTGGDYRQKD